MEFQAALNGKKIKIPRVGLSEEARAKDVALSPEDEARIQAKAKESIQKKILEKANERGRRA